jgi:hypothetical protein
VIYFFQGERIFLFIISISLHNLRIVSGFFLLNNDDSFNVFGLLKKHNRLCQLCQSREIGDEFHYVLQCPNFVTDRKNLIPKYFFNRPNTLKLSSLFNKKKPETIRKLCKLKACESLQVKPV